MRLPPCRPGTHGSEHPYCFCGSVMRVPSSHPALGNLHTPCLPAMGHFPAETAVFFWALTPCSPAAGSAARGLAACSLLSVFTHPETSDAFLLPDSGASRPAAAQSVSSLASLIQRLHFFSILFSSPSSRHLSSHADHLVRGSGSGSEPSVISTW